MVVVGMTEGRARCTKQFARIVKKNVKSHLSPEKTGLFIARTVFQSIKTAADIPSGFAKSINSPSAQPLAGFFLEIPFHK